LIDTDDRHRGQ